MKSKKGVIAIVAVAVLTVAAGGGKIIKKKYRRDCYKKERVLFLLKRAILDIRKM